MPEREIAPSQEGIQATLEAPVVSPQMENAGVSVVPTQLTNQVIDNNGDNIIQPTPADVIIPADPKTLTSFAKGPINLAITWWGAFWERIIRKAFGQGRRTRVADANAS